MGAFSSRPQGIARRAKLLAFIRAEVAAGRGFPGAAEMQRHVGWSDSTSVRDALHKMVRDGDLRVVTRKNVGRNWYYTYGLAEVAA